MPPHNATSGPSNVPRTPSPTPRTNNRDIWAQYEQFPPPSYNPANLPPIERVAAPICPHPLRMFPTIPSAPPATNFPAPDRFITIFTDDDINHIINHALANKETPDAPISVSSGSKQSNSPIPDDTLPFQNELPEPDHWIPPISSTLTDPNMSGTSSQPSTEESSVPIEPWPGSYANVMSRLTSISEETTGLQWDGTSWWNGETQFLDEEEMQQLPQGSSPIETESYTLLCLDTYYREDKGGGQNRSNENWREHYSYSLPNNSRWMTHPVNYNQFDTFQYDYGTFGELDEVAPWIDENVSYPFTLPDSPSQQNDRRSGSSTRPTECHAATPAQPKKQEYKDIHSVYTAEQAQTKEKEESKVEEAKETVV
ncbi:hypothetical protein ARMSODRAFT_970067 [Armillaria solidipes]|uniref:Uncharacterized protein n=1 Tax=Armillaria solidipes TaxID=1076256 RepID=A0A2H3BX47_9AGAR|nr:hypothetical protein ARMSODRAFT_970067 [Armillaria solidipes]